ncbi:chemotaxis protein CheB [Hydrocarboniclastica marina]|uniref:protein-glutamate methylesterase n=1 Tax=Hydrocarboniclastica marina TaxID=2259620 RepID=A0A4V1D8K2_9ALTE|nr:chemotaxis protein CheB [Hydrocarboniclastica marina]MAL97064.1 chemotaxis protein CheB [Alteromonadaceae bacterium]QCF25480.1 chemotaxis protein CheB [Hydrocarboniclastica marina]|tara:strand:+ start:432 stop:1412 length:981 start_codon:yes stop_codon:yes gene_type:complete
MDKHDIIVVGASLGGVETLPRLLAQLPADLPASVFIVQHVAPQGPGLLANILNRACAMPVGLAQDGQAIEKSRVYLAPPDHHMLLDADGVRVVHGPKENSSRPAIDPLFRSAAARFGPRVIGIILTGALDDGSSGLRAVKRCNGLTLVQEPRDAFCQDMPSNALATAEPVDYQLAVAEMGQIIQKLVAQPAGERVPVPKDIQLEVRMAERTASITEEEMTGSLVPIICPDCGGTLWEHDDGKLQRFRCHVGHSFTALSLLAAQSEEVERSLWVTLRSLEERTELLSRMTESALRRGHSRTVDWYSEKMADIEDTTEKIRSLLTGQS